MSSGHSPSDRLNELEMLVTHLQHDYEALNSVVLEQQKQIDALRQQLSRLDHRVMRLGEEDEPRDPIAERPPHY